MPAAINDIIIEQGATLQLRFVYEDATETPINLTGYTARMQVRRKYASTDTLLNFTTENGGIVITPLTGTINVVGAATLTKDLPAKPCVYDLELVSPAGIVYRLVQGSVTVTPEVTR